MDPSRALQEGSEVSALNSTDNFQFPAQALTECTECNGDVAASSFARLSTDGEGGRASEKEGDSPDQMDNDNSEGGEFDIFEDVAPGVSKCSAPQTEGTYADREPPQLSNALERETSQEINRIENKVVAVRIDSSTVNTSDDFISTVFDDVDRSPSPFIVLDHVEDGGCLTYQGTVDSAMLPLKEERARILQRLGMLRATEQSRRQQLCRKYEGKVNKRMVSLAVTAAEQIDAPYGNSTYLTSSSVVSTNLDTQHNEAEEREQEQDQDQDQVLPQDSRRGETTVTRGVMAGCSTTVSKEVTGSVREGASLVCDQVDNVESDEDEPHFTERLTMLDCMTQECYKGLVQEGEFFSGEAESMVSENSADTDSSGDGVHSRADNMTVCDSVDCNKLDTAPLEGFYIPVPMDRTGQVEYVFNGDDAQRRLKFRREEYELQRALGRVEGKIDALTACRLSKGIHYWQSDDSTDSCPRCGKVFSFTVRRHHCRRCGVLLCNDCCSQVGRDMYVQVRTSAVTSSDVGPSHGSSSSQRTTRNATDDAWLFGTCEPTGSENTREKRPGSTPNSLQPNQTISDTWQYQGSSSNNNSLPNCICLPNNGRRDYRGRGGLKVRYVPWVRICNACYLVCLRARLEGNYKPILEDNRRRFHVLKEEEQSLLCINSTWEMRWAQLNVLKHVVIERTVHMAHDQVQQAVGVLSDWLQEWRLCLKP